MRSGNTGASQGPVPVKPMTDILLTVQEYAAIFRRNPSSVYTAIRKNRLPYPVERPTGTNYYLIRVPACKVAQRRAETVTDAQRAST